MGAGSGIRGYGLGIRRLGWRRLLGDIEKPTSEEAGRYNDCLPTVYSLLPNARADCLPPPAFGPSGEQGQ